MGRTSKQTKKFAASGQLKKQIQARKKHQEMKRRVERRKGPGALSKDAQASGGKGQKGSRDSRGKGKQVARDGKGEDGDEDEEMSEVGKKGKGKGDKKGAFKGMSVDDFLGGGFLEGGDDEVSLHFAWLGGVGVHPEVLVVVF